MSAEIIATLTVGATLLVSTLSGFAWLITRVDTRIDALDDILSSRMDRLEVRADGMQHELTEVKIAVARIEGPPRRLLAP